MQLQEERLIAVLHRVDDFLSLYRVELEGTVLPAARLKLAAVRDALEAEMKAQDGSARAALDRMEVKDRLRRTLVDSHMRPIAAMARSEVERASRPAALKVATSVNRYGTLIAAGYGMAQAAAPHREALVAGGLKEDFIERLIAATNALRDADSAAAQVVGARVEATALLKERGRAARRYLHALDRIIRSEIQPDQALFGRWVSVSRVASVAATAVANAPGSGSGTPQEGSGVSDPDRVAA
jgi:hypothetical protein